jgi:drug/metabolite transporter (DMT)-like permease
MEPPSSSRAISPALRGVLFGLLGAFFSACFLIPWKLATQHGEAKHATLVLLASAALFNTLAIAPMHNDKAPPLAVGPTLRLAAAFAALSLAGNWFSAESVHRVSGALLAVLQRCEVLVVGLLGSLILGERARPSFWIGSAIAGCGLIVLSTRAGGGLGLGPNADPIGALCGLASAVCFGAMNVLTRKHIHKLRPVLLNATRLWFGVLLWFAIERTIPIGALTPSFVLYAALAAFFGPFLSRLAVMESAHHVPASTTVLASLVTPPITLLLGFGVLGTLPSAHELMGGAIMLTGVAIPVLCSLREDRAVRSA